MLRTNERPILPHATAKKESLRVSEVERQVSVTRPNRKASTLDYLSKSNIAIRNLALGRGNLCTGLWHHALAALREPNRTPLGISIETNLRKS